MAGDDSSDDGERTRIGGLPPAIPKAPAPSAPAAPASAGGGDAGERTQIAPARPPGAPAVAAAPAASPPAAAPAADDAGERTRIVTGAPPGAAAAPASAVPPAAAPSAGEGGDRTQFVASAPPGSAAPGGDRTQVVASAPPGSAAPGGDRTQVVASPPPGAARAASAAEPPAAAAGSPPAAAAPAAAPARPAVAAPMAADVTVDPARARAGGADDEERTVVLTRRVESTVRLERVAPKDSAETIELDRPSLVFGRGHGCDVKLVTPTASREHARIFFKDGRWTIESLERKTFYVDGARHAAGAIPLVNGMRLRLGDDEFLVVDAAGGAVAARGGGLWVRIVSFVRGLVGRRG